MSSTISLNNKRAENDSRIKKILSKKSLENLFEFLKSVISAICKKKETAKIGCLKKYKRYVRK
jgi:hypothetical protein